MKKHRRSRRRAGKILVLSAMLLTPTLAGLAVSVDVGVLATARAQLQNSADAAAIAGAMQLISENRARGATNLSVEMTAARAQATSFAQANTVLGVAPVVNDNSGNSSSGDVVCGYVNPASPGSGMNSSGSGSVVQLYNAVQVNLARDAAHGGVVPGSFSPVIGVPGVAVSVQATAMAQPFTITGVRAVGNRGANMLPMVLAQANYNAMINGQTADQFAYNTSTNTVMPGSDGVYESVLVPVNSGNAGNWGLLNIAGNGTSTLNNEILNGYSAQELSQLPGGTLSLDPSLNPPSITLAGDPGIHGGIKSALTSIIGKQVIVPVYDQTGGVGTNSWYRIVAFAACRLMAVNFNGNPKFVIVQPSSYVEPTAILSSTPSSSWTQGGAIQIRLVR